MTNTLSQELREKITAQLNKDIKSVADRSPGKSRDQALHDFLRDHPDNPMAQAITNAHYVLNGDAVGGAKDLVKGMDSTGKSDKIKELGAANTKLEIAESLVNRAVGNGNATPLSAGAKEELAGLRKDVGKNYKEQVDNLTKDLGEKHKAEEAKKAEEANKAKEAEEAKAAAEKEKTHPKQSPSQTAGKSQGSIQDTINSLWDAGKQKAWNALPQDMKDQFSKDKAMLERWEKAYKEGTGQASAQGQSNTQQASTSGHHPKTIGTDQNNGRTLGA